MKQIRLAAIGLGGRSSGYFALAKQRPDRYLIVAGADPKDEAQRNVLSIVDNPQFQLFQSDKEILAQPRLADVMIIGTQDAQHREHALAAMEKGYDLVLEKPIASNIRDVLAVNEAASRLGRRVLVCHVLRYTALYSQIKKLVDSGRIGKIISLNATEGVGAFHQAHSYVRGNWSRIEDSSPMIVAKSCHDLDIIYWIVGKSAVSVTSYGGLKYFTAENAPHGSPHRCADGCPINYRCFYDAHHYADSQKAWLYINPDLQKPGTSKEDIVKWISKSPWGRCVYHCDNTAVDHQVVAVEFAEGVTATFTMTAFAQGRTIEIFGTKGVIRAGALYTQSTGSEILIQNLDSKEVETLNVTALSGGYDSHGGGDEGLVEALYDEMQKPSAEEMSSSIQTSVMSHLMGFAAEESRIQKKTINLEEYRRRCN